MIDHVVVNMYGNEHLINLNSSLEDISVDLHEVDYFKYDYDVCEDHSENYIEVCLIYNDYVSIYESYLSYNLVDISINLGNVINDYNRIEEFITFYDKDNNKIDIYSTIYAGIPAVNVGKSLTLMEDEKFNISLFKYRRENEIQLILKNKLCNTIKSIYIIDSGKKNCVYSDNVINSSVVDLMECEYILDIMVSSDCIYLNFNSHEYFRNCVSIELIDGSFFEISLDNLSIFSCFVKKSKQYKLHSFSNFDLSMDITETSGKTKYGLLFVKTDKK